MRVAGITKKMQAVETWARRFFSMDFEDKRNHGAGPGPGQAHGYMNLTWTEVFEVRCWFDQNFSWPAPAMKLACLDLRDLLKAASVLALNTLCDAAGIKNVASSLLDTEREDDLSLTSNSALRVLLYSTPSKDAPNQHAFATGIHTDNSFLTLAPRASVAALEISPFTKEGGNTWVNIELEMGEDVVCCFVGDSLGLLTKGFYPSVVHRPNEQLCLEPLAKARSAKERAMFGRISCPFFLRGKQNARVDAATTVSDIEINKDMCRLKWDWKQFEYYKSQTFHKKE